MDQTITGAKRAELASGSNWTRKACVWFVMGKGGVGRTTTAAALGAEAAARGERALIVQWSLGDDVAPLFGAPAGGFEERAIAPGLYTMNYSAEETLREYFVDHLKLRWFYRAVVQNRHVQRFSRAAPGLEELLFLGRLTWLTASDPPSALEDRGWRYDRVIVDAPALGHGLSLFGVARAARSLDLGGMLAAECARVVAMLDERAAAVLVTTAEELAVEETLELLPRLRDELPLISLINRSVARLGPLPPSPSWLDPALAPLYESLLRRRAREELLRQRLPAPVLSIDDALTGDRAPLACAREAAACLG
jgi:anion-transporting  ArsA/GET3 family ATPase